MYENKTNANVREYIKQSGLRHWQVARQMGISENTLSMWFRDSLDPSRVKSIMHACDELVFARQQMNKEKKRENISNN